MSNESLKIIRENSVNSELKQKQEKVSKKDLAQAYFDRIWFQNPEKFLPENSALELDKQEKIFYLISNHFDINEKKVADLGCGAGFLSRKLRDLGAKVYAVDVSLNALNNLKKKDFSNITPIHDYIPHSLLPDDFYDLVVGTDLIADLEQSEYRIFFSELARIMKSQGYVVCSTSIDIYSEDALQRFADLASTEFEFIKWKFSYHSLYIKILKFFKIPSNITRGWKEKRFREKELCLRGSLSKLWYKINSQIPFVFFWQCLSFITNPIVKFLKKSKRSVNFFEKVSKFLWQESAISHAIFIGKRHALFFEKSKETHPNEMKHKKQVWE